MRNQCFTILGIFFLLHALAIPLQCGEKEIVLLTEYEAALPDPPERYFDIGRAEEEDGPQIKIVKPEEAEVYRSPLGILIEFVPGNGREIDLKKFRIECLKIFTIDITEKVLPYTTKQGIVIERAVLPKGVHRFRLIVGDSSGVVKQKILTVRIH